MGRDTALGELVGADVLERNLRWVDARVRRRLGWALRARAESRDYVQACILRYLSSPVGARLTSDVDFRRLMSRIVESTLCDEHRWMHRLVRNVRRARPLGAGGAPLPAFEPDPADAAEARERRQRVRRALDYLGTKVLARRDDSIPLAPCRLPTANCRQRSSAPLRGAPFGCGGAALWQVPASARRVVLLRVWGGLGFAEIARRVGTSPEAARKRYDRAVAGLAFLLEPLGPA